MNPNNRGIVLCFLIYIALCATVVSIIEMPWLTVPKGSKFNVDMSKMSTKDISFVTANLSADANVTFTAKTIGYCGVSGYCYPFEEDSPMLSLLTGKWGSRCSRLDPIHPLRSGKQPKFVFNMTRHLPFYMCIGGSVFLLFTWIVGICACCNQDCGKCTIYSVLAVTLTFGATVFGVGGMLFFLFSKDEGSCIKQLCGSQIESAFKIGDCKFGWSLYVAIGGVGLAYILAILSCVLAAKTPLRNKSLNNPIIEVRSAQVRPNYGRHGKLMTTRA